MTPLVVDASVVIKFVVDEEGKAEADRLLGIATLCAPDLLTAECANILWKKARRKEMSTADAIEAAELLRSADIELVPMRWLLAEATRLSIEIDHPAYACFYIALASARACRLVTADLVLVRKLATTAFGSVVVPLNRVGDLK